ncbi:MAG: hypothetical protein HY862_03680 [Chloroflexi bacterium]|nr:hypothetical protein [Chloroflexota bacterium]
MYDPTLDILVFPTTPKATFELISEDAIEDQYLAWRDQSYGFLMTQLLTSDSETETTTARQLLLDKPYQIKYSRVLGEAYAYVETEDGQCWTRLFKHDLRNERQAMLNAGELSLAHRFAGLIDLLDFAACARRAKAS